MPPTDRVYRLHTVGGLGADHPWRAERRHRVLAGASGNEPLLRVGSNHGPAVVELEPLDEATVENLKSGPSRRAAPASCERRRGGGAEARILCRGGW